jgi:cytochrome c-type biogenesis protein CcmE
VTASRPHRPALTRRRRRLYLLGAAAVVLGLAATLILNAFEDNLVFFYSPTDLATRADVPKDRLIRIGGLVEKGSISRNGAEVRFTVTDTANRLSVVYRGILPDLFREGQGVVAQGRVTAPGTFEARDVLAKHDETYMPREVADAIKRSGQWKDSGGKASAGEGTTP